MTTFDHRKAKERVLAYFPQWMDISKRSYKSTGAVYLEAVADEEIDIEAAYEEFRSGFFLKRLEGKEEEILSQVYVANVGRCEEGEIDCDYNVTFDPHEFVANPDSIVLYQDGYLLISPKLIDEKEPYFKYEHNGLSHEVTVKKTPLWNVFDEFALFSGLQRYDGESNTELVNRIYASYIRPTSSSAAGLKNAIINAVMNYDTVEPEDIKFEHPTGKNMMLKDSAGNVIYENMSALNKDIAREKTWNKSNWENDFKKTSYLDNEWDAQLESIQPGVGQGDDLSSKLSSDVNSIGTTDVSIVPYRESKVYVNDYIRKQGLRRNIPLKLTRYRDELKEKSIEYKITASVAKQIDPQAISIRSQQHVSGIIECPLEEIVADAGAVTVITPEPVNVNSTYALEFSAPSAYSSMNITTCRIKHNDGTYTDCLAAAEEYNGFKKDKNGGIYNSNIKAHIERIKDLSTLDNMEDVMSGGFTIGTESTSGSFTIDLAGMEGSPIKTSISCQETNYTNNSRFVTMVGGFKLKEANEIEAETTDSSSSIIIDMDCASISYELAKGVGQQGSISVQFEVDGELDVEKSGLFTEPQKFSYDFQNSRHVRIIITKAGMYPVAIRNIKAARYHITYSLKSGEIIHNPFFDQIPLIENNKLYVKVVSYSNYTPVFDYIHIGSAVGRSVYKIEKIKPAKNGVFQIETNCRVKLLKNGEVVSDDYSTKKRYKNEMTSKTSMVINLEKFISVEKADRTITPAPLRGKTCSYITLQAGEEIDSIKITGTKLESCGSKTLASIIGAVGAEKVYMAGNAPGMVVLSSNGNTRLRPIYRSDLPEKADSFEFQGLTDDMRCVFVTDSDAHTQSIQKDSIAQTFEYAYLRSADEQEYVAYNTVKMLQSPMDGVELVNTFSPMVDSSKLLFYCIDDIVGEVSASAMFAHSVGSSMEYCNWALGANHNGIRVEYDFGCENSSAYQLDVNNMTETFALSNNISLSGVKYKIDDEEYALARFIVTPPDDMNLTYKLETVQEKVYVHTGGFNKLYYSNVRRIEGVTVNNELIPAGKYDLLPEAGIIVWKDMAAYAGAEASIIYEYAAPVSLEFKDLSYLYELVGYSADAYEPMTDKPIVLRGLHSGSSYNVSVKGETPSRLIVRCENDNFYANVDRARVTVQAYPSSNNVMVRSGFYYDEDKEYYLFEHDYSEKVDQMANVEFERVRRIGDLLRGHQASSNLLFDSIMTNGDHFEKACHIDCISHQSRIEGISALKAVTACDTYQQWIDFNMDVSLVTGLNGMGLQFHPTAAGGYALLNISSMVEKGSKLSLYADASLKLYVMREVLAGEDSLRRSIFCSKLGECKVDESIRSYEFDDVDDRQLYLCAMGDGVIDDIIIQKPGIVASADVHKKTIDLIGLEIPEQVVEAMEVPVQFNRENNYYEGLELDNHGVLDTGSTADWGITKVIDYKDKFSRFVCSNVDQRKEAFYSAGESGYITTPWMYVKSLENASSIYLKINDVLLDGLAYFNVRVNTADGRSGYNAREAYVDKKTNLVEVPASVLGPYVQFIIEMPPQKVINNLEVYVRYVEKNDHTLHISEMPRGEMITKIYDMVTPANYALKSIGASSVIHPEDIVVSIRGIREDAKHAVATEWYPCTLDESLQCEDPHIFFDYKFFQFKIEILNMDASIKIDEFIFEVI